MAEEGNAGVWPVLAVTATVLLYVCILIIALGIWTPIPLITY